MVFSEAGRFLGQAILGTGLRVINAGRAGNGMQSTRLLRFRGINGGGEDDRKESSSDPIGSDFEPFLRPGSWKMRPRGID